MLHRWDRVEQPPNSIDWAAYRVEGLRLGSLNGLLRLLRTNALPQRMRERLFQGLGWAYMAQGRGLPHTAVYHRVLTFNSKGLAAPHEVRELALPLDRAQACRKEARRIMLATPSAACIETQIRFSPAADVQLAPNMGRPT